MRNVLFVCHGNICRSPMGEYILKNLVRARGLEGRYHIESAAVSREELGNPVYPPARAELAKHGIDCRGHAARQITPADYRLCDDILYMDGSNLRYLLRLFPGDPAGKLHRLTEFGPDRRDVEDPWYTGDFAGVYRQIAAACGAYLDAREAV